MQTKRKLGNAGLAALAAAAFTTTLTAQSTNKAVETPSSTESLTRPLYYPWTVGVDGGSTGFGLFGSWRFLDHLGVRAGFDFLQISDNNNRIRDITYNTTVRLLSEPLTLDIYPWKKHSFHISAGLMFNQNELTGTSSDTRILTIAGRSFTVFPGTLNLNIQQQLVNPYLSFGGNFFYFDHAHRWAMGGELGVAYTGTPDASLTQSGGRGGIIDTALLRAEQGRVQDWAEQQYKWWPVLKLMVTYSF